MQPKYPIISHLNPWTNNSFIIYLTTTTTPICCYVFQTVPFLHIFALTCYISFAHTCQSVPHTHLTLYD